MKTMLFAFVAMLATLSVKAQPLYLTITNYSNCDVDVQVRTIDAFCGTAHNFGTINLLNTHAADYEDVNTGGTAVEYEVIITVDPGGTPVVLPTLTTNGGCGGNPNPSDPTACSPFGASANTTGSSPTWNVDIL